LDDDDLDDDDLDDDDLDDDDLDRDFGLPRMTKAVARGLLLAAIALMAMSSPRPALAQSGSAGGAIGNDDKSVSGSRQDRSAEPAPSPRNSRPTPDEPRSSARRSGGGGNFDGAWVVVSIGCGGASTGAVMVTSGRIIGEGVTGRVSPNGAASSVGHYNGITVISSGHVSGRSGTGTFHRSDGCSGTWSSSKQ
jgi:hypothetical protein